MSPTHDGCAFRWFSLHKKRATLEAAWTCPKNESNKWLANDGDHFKCGLSRKRAGSKRTWQDANFTHKMMRQPNVWSILEGETKACWCAQVGCWHTKEKNTPSCSALRRTRFEFVNEPELSISLYLPRQIVPVQPSPSIPMLTLLECTGNMMFPLPTVQSDLLTLLQKDSAINLAV